MDLNELMVLIKEHLPTVIAFATVFAYWLLDIIYKNIAKKSSIAIRNFVMARNKDVDDNLGEVKSSLRRLVNEKSVELEKAREQLMLEKERIMLENEALRREIDIIKNACKIGFSNINDLVEKGLARDINCIIDKVETEREVG